MSKKCKAYSESKLGLEPPDNRKAFYAGWDAALAEPEEKYRYGTPLLDAMTGNAEQPAQQEWPKPKFVRNVDGVPCITLVEHEYLMRSRTSPPTSKPWVGLTDEEIVRCVVHHRFEYDPPYIDKNGTKHVAHYVIQPGPTYRNIDALLREKNTGETK